jgi:small nuclear ribonucleoprotein (snRNP)-like protein
MPSAIDEYVGREVVLDVASRFVFVGTLSSYDEHQFVLVDADVHDLRDTTTTREVYVLDSKRHGVRANRKRVVVRRDEVVSLSALAEVIE